MTQQEVPMYRNPYTKEGTPYVNRYGNPIVSQTNNQKLAHAQIYAATQMFTGEDPDVVLKRAEKGFPVNVFRDTNAAINGMLEQHRAELAENLRTDPENAETYKAETVQKVQETTESLRDEVLGQYVDIVIQDPEIAKASPLVQKDVAANMYLQSQMAAIADKAGIKDWAGAILIPNFSAQAAETIQKFHPERAKVTSYIKSAEYLHEIAQAYNSLPPEQKIEFIDAMVEQLPGITGNEVQQMELLMSVTGQQTLKEMKFNQWLDKFDAITLGATGVLKAGQVATKAARSFNAVKALTKGGNTDIAGYAADEILRNPDKARKFGMSDLDAAISADPRQSEELLEMLNAAPRGVATEVRGKLDAIDAFTEEAMNVVDQGLGLGQAEKLRIQETQAKYLVERLNVENVKAVDQTDMGFTLRFDMKDADGNVTKGRVEVPYTVDDVTGTFVERDSAFAATMPILRNIVGTSVKAGKDRDRLLSAYEQIDFASRKIGRMLNEGFNTATKGLNKKSIDNLEYFLSKTQQSEKWYSYDKLVHQGIGGKRMTPKEYTAYASTKGLMDNLWQIKNSQMRRDLIATGHKDVLVDGTVYKAKPYAEYGSARAAYDNMGMGSVRIETPLLKEHNAGFAKQLSADQLQAYYDKGYVLTRSNMSNAGEMFPSSAMGHSPWALVEAKKVNKIGPVVLRKRSGYIPISYEKARYFVKQTEYAKINGAATAAGMKTLRYFDNIDDAEKYVDQLENAATKSGQPFDRKDFSVLGDREMTAAQLEGEVTAQWGGLYSGYRGEERIKYGLAGHEGALTRPIEAIQDYVKHIATRYPMSQYRMGMEQRWMNHAKDVIPELRNNFGMMSFKNSRAIVESSQLGNSAAKKKLLDAHDQITFMNRTPTIGEEQTVGSIRKINEAMSRWTIGGTQPLKPLARAMGDLNNSDPVAALKTAAFHMYLGVFNFSQFFVQGMGATVAISISPVHAARGMAKMPGFGLLDNVLDPRARKVALEKVSKIAGDDFKEAYTAWQKSGLHESAMITNADAYTISKGMPVSQGALGKFVEKGTMFFSAGELANLRMSFLTSYQKWKAINKSKKMSDADLKSIIAETEKFRLHMTNANKGDFQKGILSLPTQFLQINVRYMEALFGKELSNKHFWSWQKTGLVLGQLSFFGAAGVPFAKYALEPVLNTFGVSPADMSEEDMIKAQRGVLGWLLNDYMDIDAVFTSRVAIGEGVTDTLVGFIGGKETSIPDLLLGPVGGVIDNSLKALSDAMFVKEGIISSDDLTLQDMQMVGETFSQMLLNVPSSTRNLMKAMYLQQSGIQYDKQGNHIMTSDAPTRDVLAQALGFGSQDVDDFWEIVIDNKDVETAKKGAADMIMRSYMNMFAAARDNDTQKQRAFELTLRATYSMFPNPKDRNEVLDAVMNRITSGGNRVDKEVRKHIEWYGSELGKTANELIPLIKKYRDQREENAGNL